MQKKVGGMKRLNKTDHAVGVGFLEKFYRISRTALLFVAVGDHHVRAFHHIFVPFLHSAGMVTFGKGHFFVRFFQNFHVTLFIRFGKILFLTIAGDARHQLDFRIFLFKG